MRCSKQLQIAEAVRAIAARKKENMRWRLRSRRLSRLRKKRSLQLRMVTENGSQKTNCTQQENKVQVVAEEDARRIADQSEARKEKSPRTEAAWSTLRRGSRTVRVVRCDTNFLVASLLGRGCCGVVRFIMLSRTKGRELVIGEKRPRRAKATTSKDLFLFHWRTREPHYTPRS